MRHKVNYCIFCNTSLTEKNTSIEHIIPKTLHSSDKLVIEICSKCNNYLSKDIEQPMIQFLKGELAHLKLDGYDLKLGRRARKQTEFVVDKGLIIIDGEKKSHCKGEWVIDTKMNKKYLLFSQISKEIPDLTNSTGGKMIIPVQNHYDYQLLLYKILFEIGFFLFGKPFIESDVGKNLKNDILNKNLPTPVSNLDDKEKNTTYQEDKLLYELDFNDPLVYDSGNPEKSAFDNKPHITFAILRDPNGKWLSVLNLWGIHEFTYSFDGLNNTISEKLEKNEGIVLLIETNKKKRLKYIPISIYDNLKKRKGLLK